MPIVKGLDIHMHKQRARRTTPPTGQAFPCWLTAGPPRSPRDRKVGTNTLETKSRLSFGVQRLESNASADLQTARLPVSLWRSGDSFKAKPLVVCGTSLPAMYGTVIRLSRLWISPELPDTPMTAFDGAPRRPYRSLWPSCVLRSLEGWPARFSLVRS